MTRTIPNPNLARRLQVWRIVKVSPKVKVSAKEIVMSIGPNIWATASPVREPSIFFTLIISRKADLAPGSGDGGAKGFLERCKGANGILELGAWEGDEGGSSADLQI